MPIILGLMKLDYFLNHKYKPRKIWWEFSLSRGEQNDLLRRLAEHPEAVSSRFAALGIAEKDIHKHVMLERLPFLLDRYLETGDLDTSSDQLLIVYFPPDLSVKPQAYMMSLAGVGA